MRLDIVNHTICLFIDWSAIYVHEENIVQVLNTGRQCEKKMNVIKKNLKKNCYILWSGLVEAMRAFDAMLERHHTESINEARSRYKFHRINFLIFTSQCAYYYALYFIPCLMLFHMPFIELQSYMKFYLYVWDLFWLHQMKF
jgi:hypothetical protein